MKTLGPSQPDEEYAATRAFYEARGFVPIEEFIDFWDDEPMLYGQGAVTVACG